MTVPSDTFLWRPPQKQRSLYSAAVSIEIGGVFLTRRLAGTALEGLAEHEELDLCKNG